MSCRRFTTWPKLCRGTPVLDKDLMATYEPEVGEMYDGRKRVLAPDTPYAAAVAQNAIYFIDQRYDVASAKHIKTQLENLVPESNGHWFIDEIDAIAERRDVQGKTLFTFDPAYARVLFADSMNGRNPSLKLPVHEPAGEWLVVYDLKGVEFGERARRIGTGLDPRKNKDERNNGGEDVDDFSKDALGSLKAAVDTPRFEGETDADYYLRMDRLHWD